MAFQDASRTGLYIRDESSWGETPANGQNYDQLRVTGDSLGFLKESRTSDVIRNDRQIDGVGMVGFSTGGDLNIELAVTQYNKIWEGLLDSDKTGTKSLSGVAATAPSTFAATGIGTGLSVGQMVFMSGFANAANNGAFRVTAAAADSITVSAATLVNAAASGTIKANMIRNGTTDHSFMIEKAFPQAAQYHYLNGLVCSGCRLSITAGELITGAFSFMGKDQLPVGSAYTGDRNAVSPSDPMSASANVGRIESDNTTYSGAIQSVELTIAKNVRPQPKVGQTALAGVGVGRFNLTGTMQVYFENGTEYAAMRAHTYRSLRLIMQDTAGEWIALTMPKVVFTSGPVNADGNDRDVMLPLGFQAVRDPTTGCTLQFDTSSQTNY